MIFPSLFEGFGMPVLEAMAAGVPVLVRQPHQPPGDCRAPSGRPAVRSPAAGGNRRGHRAPGKRSGLARRPDRARPPPRRGLPHTGGNGGPLLGGFPGCRRASRRASRRALRGGLRRLPGRLDRRSRHGGLRPGTHAAAAHRHAARSRMAALRGGCHPGRARKSTASPAASGRPSRSTCRARPA